MRNNNTNTSSSSSYHSYQKPAALYTMLPVDEALKLVLAELPVKSSDSKDSRGAGGAGGGGGGGETIVRPIHETIGYVLAEQVRAPVDIPDKPVSIMDGFALQSGENAAGLLSIVGENRAGNVDESIRIGKGMAAYVTTGSPLPSGADAVVMIEDTEEVDAELPGFKRIKVATEIHPGQHVRQVGSDMEKGEVIFDSGKLLEAVDVGMLASLGIRSVKVFKKPLAAFMSTGDEVVDIQSSKEKGKHQIFDANRPILCAAAQPYCERVIDLGIAGDTQERLESLFQKAMADKVDVLVTSGGVSMGDSDLIKPILESKGKVHFGKVKMKPGKPLTFATIEEGDHKLLVFALPGNPVSSFVTFNLIVIPTLRKLSGWTSPHSTRLQVRTGGPIEMDPKRPEYHRAALSWSKPGQFSVLENPSPSDSENAVLIAHSTGNQRSSRLLSLRNAQALLEIPQGSGIVPAGTLLSAILISPSL